MAKTLDRVRPIDVGEINAIPMGQGRCYIVGTEEIALFRQRDGRLFAAQNRCPHRSGPLAEGLLGGNHVICPLHAHKFNLDTGKGTEPNECLRVYTVREVEGKILLSPEDVDS